MFSLVLSLLLTYTAAEFGLDDLVDFSAGMCYRVTYGRGVGKVLQCDPDSSHPSYDAGLCYERCNSGYSGVATLCYKDCPSGMRDDGLYCYKGSPYGRGAGYALWDQGKCESDNPDLGCEKWGALWYPKCREGYYNQACCICSPVCPSGFDDIGISCHKPSYGRGIGLVINSCKGYGSDYENDASLCYEKCRTDYEGVGPVCWGDCSAQGKIDCGMMCAESTEQCIGEVAKMAIDTLEVVVEAVLTEGESLPGGVVTLIKTYNYPICGDEESKTISEVIGKIADLLGMAVDLADAAGR